MQKQELISRGLFLSSPQSQLASLRPGTVSWGSRVEAVRLLDRGAALRLSGEGGSLGAGAGLKGAEGSEEVFSLVVGAILNRDT